MLPRDLDVEGAMANPRSGARLQGPHRSRRASLSRSWQFIRQIHRAVRTARQEGFLTVAHAGEGSPAEYVREAIESLHVSRIERAPALANRPQELTVQAWSIQTIPKPWQTTSAAYRRHVAWRHRLELTERKIRCARPICSPLLPPL